MPSFGVTQGHEAEVTITVKLPMPSVRPPIWEVVTASLKFFVCEPLIGGREKPSFIDAERENRLAKANCTGAINAASHRE